MRTSCSKCGGTEFYKNRDCKSCAKISGAKYRKENSEKEKVRKSRWQKDNPKSSNIASAKWAEKNPDKVVARNAKRYAENPGKCKAASSAWYANHPEARCIYEHNRNAKIRANGGKLSKGLAVKLLKLQQGKCACCRNHLIKYHLDHMMPIALEGANTDDNIQLLCPTCNQQKNAKHPVDFMQSRGFLL